MVNGRMVLNCAHFCGNISSRLRIILYQTNMPPRRKLGDFDRTRAIAWMQDGVAAREVARRLAVSHSVIIRLRQRHQATGSVQERPRAGRPKKTTQREDRYIRIQALQRRTTTANTIRHHLRGATNTAVSSQTVRRRLHAANIRARRPVKKPKLTAGHRASRLAWCRAHEPWTRAQWGQVLFTDESRFMISPKDGRVRVWRRPGEQLMNNTLMEVTPFGGGSVMVWGGISRHHRTPLYHIDGNLNGQRYLQEIVQPMVTVALQQIGQNAILQDDNATPHRSRVVNAFIRQAGITRMPWPANSPDLNPIENVWAELGRRVQQHQPPPANRQELLQILQQEWTNIPQAFITRTINSMRQRCLDCLRNQGGHTRF